MEYSIYYVSVALLPLVVMIISLIFGMSILSKNLNVKMTTENITFMFIFLIIVLNFVPPIAGLIILLVGIYLKSLDLLERYSIVGTLISLIYISASAALWLLALDSVQEYSLSMITYDFVASVILLVISVKYQKFNFTMQKEKASI